MHKYMLLAAALLLTQFTSIAQKSNDPLWYNMGTRMYDQHQYQEAVYCFTRSIEVGYSIARSYAYRGDSKMIMGKRDSARADLDSALLLDPKDGYIYLFKGRLLLAKNNSDSAAYWVKKALAIEPANARFNDQVAAIFAMKNQFDSALRYSEKATTIEPANVVYLYNYAFINQNLGRYQRALNNYQLVAKLTPEELENPETLTNIAYCKYGLKSYAEAMSICNHLFEKHPGYGYIYGVSGLTNYSLGNKEKACADLKKFALNKPRPPKASEYLKQCGCPPVQ